MKNNKKDIKTEEKKSKKYIFYVAKGSIVATLISIVLIFIMSVILTFSNVSETIIPTSVIIISSLSVLAGSILSAIGLNKNGLINGATVGIVYILIIYILSSIMTTEFNINVKSLIMALVSITTGMVGGIIGVNIRKN